MNKQVLWSLVCMSIIGIVGCRQEINVERLPERDVAHVKALIEKLEPLIRERDAQSTLATLTFDELYAPLNARQRRFLELFRMLDAKSLGIGIPYRGIATGKEELVTLTGQTMTVKGEQTVIQPQFLPPVVHANYLRMMDAMEKDIGKRLLVESGYRSSAYQLYLFVYYLKNHEYSIRETTRFVALPGYSEHGSVEHQAVDFINTEGINGEYNPSEFDSLPEYAWLTAHAAEYGFVLSYPKTDDPGITYEPWHWRYEGGNN